MKCISQFAPMTTTCRVCGHTWTFAVSATRGRNCPQCAKAGRAIIRGIKKTNRDANRAARLAAGLVDDPHVDDHRKLARFCKRCFAVGGVKAGLCPDCQRDEARVSAMRAAQVERIATETYDPYVPPKETSILSKMCKRCFSLADVRDRLCHECRTLAAVIENSHPMKRQAGWGAMLGNSVRRRASMYARTPYCYWCHRDIAFEESTIEHLLPISKGGTDASENLRIACSPCNNARGSNVNWKPYERWYAREIGRGS